MKINTGKPAATIQWLKHRTKITMHDPKHREVLVSSDYHPWLYIKFQEGPVKEVGWNGICMLDIFQACIDRLKQFETKWPCTENKKTITNLELAKDWLKLKRARRLKERGQNDRCNTLRNSKEVQKHAGQGNPKKRSNATNTDRLQHL